jgi:hypothetical protein
MSRGRAVPAASAAALALVGAGLAGAALLPGAASASTPDEPVRLAVSAPPVVSLDALVAVSVSVTSDPGAFDIAEAPVRLRVRVSGAQCRDTFATTTGPVAIDQRLSLPGRPSPAFATTLTGRARPADFGTSTVCAFVEEEGSDRLFAADGDTRVVVSRACTDASRRQAALTLALTGARRDLGRARRALSRAHRRRARGQARRRVGSLNRQLSSLTRSLDVAQRTVSTACA